MAFAGTPRFAVPTLQALAARHEVVGVLTQPDRPAGRGRKSAASAVKLEAIALGLELAQPAELKSAAGRAALAGWHPDVLVVVAYGLILPPAVLELPRLGCINVHASLLPRWRGAAPIQRAVLSGDATTGICIMRMEAGLDTGPVYIERRIPIEADSTASGLEPELARLGAEALLEALDGIVAGTLAARPQAAEGLTYAAKITKAEARIDWRQPAAEIDRRIRAFDAWPVAETTFEGEVLRIHRARLELDSAPGDAVGEVAYAESSGLRVRCGAGAVRILELQRAGRRRVAGAEFGRSLPPQGARFE